MTTDRNIAQKDILKYLSSQSIRDRVMRDLAHEQFVADMSPTINVPEITEERNETLSERETFFHKLITNALLHPDTDGIKEDPFIEQFTGSGFINPDELFDQNANESTFFGVGAGMQRFTTRFDIGELKQGENINVDGKSNEYIAELAGEGYHLVTDSNGRKLMSNDGATINNYGTNEQLMEFMKQTDFKPWFDPETGRLRKLHGEMGNVKPWAGHTLKAAIQPYYDEESGQIRGRRVLMTGENMRKMRDGEMAVTSALTNPPKGGGLIKGIAWTLVDEIFSTPGMIYSSANAIGNVFGVKDAKADSKVMLTAMSKELEGSQWNTLNSISNPGMFKSTAGVGETIGSVGSSLAQFAGVGRAIAGVFGTVWKGAQLAKAAKGVDTARKLGEVVKTMEAAEVVLPTAEKAGLVSKWLGEMGELYRTPYGAAMFATGMSMNVAEGYREALLSGVPSDDAAGIGVAYGTVASFIETALGAKMEKWLLGAPEEKAIIREIVDVYKASPQSIKNPVVLRNIGDKFLDSIKKAPGKLKTIGATVLQESAEEGTQFLAQQLTNSLYDMATSGQHFREWTTPELLSETFDNMMSGAIGALIGAPGILMSKQNNNINRDYILQQVAAGNTEQLISSIVDNIGDSKINETAARQMIADIKNFETIFKSDKEAFNDLFEITDTGKRNYAAGQVIGRIADVQEFMDNGYKNKDSKRPENSKMPSGFPLESNVLELIDLALDIIAKPIRLSDDPGDTMHVSSSFIESLLAGTNRDNKNDAGDISARKAVGQLMDVLLSGKHIGGVFDEKLNALIEKYNELNPDKKISMSDSRVKKVQEIGREFGIRQAAWELHSRAYDDYFKQKLMTEQSLFGMDGKASKDNTDAVRAYENILANIINRLSLSTNSNILADEYANIYAKLFDAYTRMVDGWAYSPDWNDDSVMPDKRMSKKAIKSAKREIISKLDSFAKEYSAVLDLHKISTLFNIDLDTGVQEKDGRKSSDDNVVSKLDAILNAFGKKQSEEKRESKTEQTTTGTKEGAPIETVDDKKELIKEKEANDNGIIETDEGIIQREKDGRFSVWSKDEMLEKQYNLGTFNTIEEAKQALIAHIDDPLGKGDNNDPFPGDKEDPELVAETDALLLGEIGALTEGELAAYEIIVSTFIGGEGYSVMSVYGGRQVVQMAVPRRNEDGSISVSVESYYLDRRGKDGKPERVENRGSSQFTTSAESITFAMTSENANWLNKYASEGIELIGANYVENADMPDGFVGTITVRTTTSKAETTLNIGKNDSTTGPVEGLNSESSESTKISVPSPGISPESGVEEKTTENLYPEYKPGQSGKSKEKIVATVAGYDIEANEKDATIGSGIRDKNHPLYEDTTNALKDFIQVRELNLANGKISLSDNWETLHSDPKIKSAVDAYIEFANEDGFLKRLAEAYQEYDATGSSELVDRFETMVKNLPVQYAFKARGKDCVVYLNSDNERQNLTNNELYAKSILVQRIIAGGGSVSPENTEIHRVASEYNFKDPSKAKPGEKLFYSLADPEMPLHIVDTEAGFIVQTRGGKRKITFGFVDWEKNVVIGGYSSTSSTANPGQTMLMFTQNIGRDDHDGGGQIPLHSREWTDAEVDFVIKKIARITANVDGYFTGDDQNKGIRWFNLFNAFFSFGDPDYAKDKSGKTIKSKLQHQFYAIPYKGKIYFGENGATQSGANEIIVNEDGTLSEDDYNALKGWLTSSKKWARFDEKGRKIPNKPFAFGAIKGFSMPRLTEGPWAHIPGESLESFMIRNEMVQINLMPGEPLVKHAELRFSPQGVYPTKKSAYSIKHENAQAAHLGYGLVEEPEKKNKDAAILNNTIYELNGVRIRNMIASAQDGDVLVVMDENKNEVASVVMAKGMTYGEFTVSFSSETALSGSYASFDLKAHPYAKIVMKAAAKQTENSVDVTQTGNDSVVKASPLPIYDPKKDLSSIRADRERIAKEKAEEKARKEEEARNAWIAEEKAKRETPLTPEDIKSWGKSLATWMRLFHDDGRPFTDEDIADFKEDYGASSKEVMEEAYMISDDKYKYMLEPFLDKKIDANPVSEEKIDPMKYDWLNAPMRAASSEGKTMDFKKELSDVERMLGKKVSKKVRVSGEKMKPASDQQILVAQSTKAGEFVEIYSPLSVIADGDPVFIHGALTRAGIVLFSGAEEGTLYHEAFHNVEMLYLSEKQRKVMYDWVRSEKGKSKYTDEMASEVLAERFRNMVLSNKSAIAEASDNKFTRTLKSIMRFLGHFIFNYVPSYKNPTELFNAIYAGHFKYNRTRWGAMSNLRTKYSAYQYKGVDFKYIGSSSSIKSIVKDLTNMLVQNEKDGKIQYGSLKETLKAQMNLLSKVGNPYLTADENKAAIAALAEIRKNVDMFSDEVRGLLKSKYQLDFTENNTDDANDVADMYGDDLSPAEIGFVQKFHIDNGNKIDPSKASSRLITAIINNLKKNSSVNPMTGMPVTVSPSLAWAEIPHMLHGAADVEDMMRIISELKSDERYQMHFPDGSIDPINMWASLEFKLNKLGPSSKKLFYSTVHMFENKYATNTMPQKGIKTTLMSEPKAFKEQRYLSDSWKNMFLADGVITSESIGRAIDNYNAAIGMLDDIFKGKIERSADILNNLYGIIIRMFGSIGMHSVSKEAIARMASQLRGDAIIDLMAKASETDDAEDIAIYHMIARDLEADMLLSINLWLKDKKKYEIKKSLDRIDAMVNKKTNALAEKHKIGKKTVPKEDYFNYIKMARAMVGVVADDIGISKQITVIGPNYNRYFVFSKRNALNDIVEVDLRNDAFRAALLNSTYASDSNWLNQINNGAYPELVTFLQFKDSDNPSGVDYSDLTPFQNLIHRLSAYASNLLPLPNMGDRSVAYLMAGLKKNKINLVNRDGSISIDDDTIGVFRRYLSTELRTIEQAKRDVLAALKAALLEDVDASVDYAGEYDRLDAELNYYVRIWENQDAEYQQMHPPVGLYDSYHYTYEWLNKEGKPAKKGEQKVSFKYKINGKGLKNMRYFDFLGDYDAIIKLTETEREEKIREFLNDKISDAIRLAAESGVITLENYTGASSLSLKDISTSITTRFNTDKVKIDSVFIPSEILDKFDDATTSNIGAGRQYNEERSIKALFALADAAMNEIITALEFEKVAMGDISFYKNLDDKQARYQMLMTTGNAVLNTSRAEYNLFNAASIFDSLDEFIETMMPGYIDMFSDLIRGSEGLKSIFNEGLLGYDDASVREQAEMFARQTLNEFRNVNKYDGSMLILPRMYAEVYDALGMWGDDKEFLLRQLEADGYINQEFGDPLTLQPLKMAYAGMHFSENGSLAIPMFDKPAIFPLFHSSISSDNNAGKLLDFLTKNKFDGIIFNDTVKLGRQPMANIRDDNGGFLLNGEAVLNNLDNYTTKRLFRNLRHQVYTEHHVEKERTVGVQVDRQAIDFLRNSNDLYEINGTHISGSELFNMWTQAHNEILDRQSANIRAKFGVEDETTARAMIKLFNGFIKESTLSIDDSLRIVSYTDENGINREKLQVNPNATMNSTTLLNSIAGAIGKDVLKIKTPGSDMIQVAFLGPVKSFFDEYHKSKFLKFRNSRGNMEIAVGAEFFRHIIPDFADYSYAEIKAEVMSDPGKYTAFLYRIPSQDVNFAAKAEIVDVLPYEIGAVVVTPTGWTTASGSDMDSDKSYLSSKYYELTDNGFQEVPFDFNKPLREQSYMAISNMLVSIYEAIESQGKNKTLSTYPTDAQTAIVKDFILNLIGRTKNSNMDFLTLNYNIDFHETVATSARLLGASAIAKSSHSIFSNFNIQVNEDANTFEFLDSIRLTNLSRSTSNDGLPISTLLNVMVTAGVDALKNPFILKANVTKNTLNSTLFAIRAGLGLAAFGINIQESMFSVSKIGLEDTLVKYYSEYMTELNGIAPNEDSMDKDSILEWIKDDLIKRTDIGELVTADGLSKLIGAEKTTDWYEKQLSILYIYSMLNTAGYKLSDAARYHNLYSNSNTSSFYNIIEFIESAESNLDALQKYFDGYSDIFSDDFIFGKQIETVGSLIEDLSKFKLIELSPMAVGTYSDSLNPDEIFRHKSRKGIYDRVNEIIPGNTNTYDRRKVFRDSIRALKMFFSVGFASRVLADMEISTAELVQLVACSFGRVSTLISEKGESNLLLASMYPQTYKGKSVLKFNNMFAKDTSTRDALYSAWDDLYTNDETRDFAQNLYLYAILTQNSGSSGVHDLISHAPESVINSLFYVGPNEEVMDQDEYYDAIMNDKIQFNERNIIDFIIGSQPADSKLIQKVGWMRGGEVKSRKSLPVKTYMDFYSTYAAKTPLAISIKSRGKMGDAVKISAGDEILIYHKIGEVKTKSEKKGAKTYFTENIYILDTQPIVEKIGTINVININKDSKVFSTKSPYSTEQIFENIASTFTDGYKTIFNPRFELRSGILDEGQKQKAGILSDLQRELDDSSESFISIENEEYSSDSTAGVAFDKIKEISGKQNMALLLRKTSLLGQELSEDLLNKIIDLYARGVYVALSPLDYDLISRINSLKKNGIISVKENSDKPIRTKTGNVPSEKVNPGGQSNEDIVSALKAWFDKNPGKGRFGLVSDDLNIMNIDDIIENMRLLELPGGKSRMANDAEWMVIVGNLTNC